MDHLILIFIIASWQYNYNQTAWTETWNYSIAKLLSWVIIAVVLNLEFSYQNVISPWEPMEPHAEQMTYSGKPTCRFFTMVTVVKMFLTQRWGVCLAIHLEDVPPPPPQLLHGLVSQVYWTPKVLYSQEWQLVPGMIQPTVKWSQSCCTEVIIYN